MGQFPSLRRHKARNCGVVRLSGHDHYLGPWPADKKHPPKDVQDAYDRLIAEWLANDRQPLPRAGGKGKSNPANPGTDPLADDNTFRIADLILRFWAHAENYYRRSDGTQTKEVDEYRQAFRPLAKLYQGLPAEEFGPLKLQAVRAAMVEAGLSRPTINRRIGRIVRAFKWAVSQELVPGPVWHALASVRGLQVGRTDAPEPQPVQAVAWEAVEAVLPHLNPVTRAMTLFAWHTGARPGEVCGIKASEIDRSGPVWVYKPVRHKMSYRDQVRAIAIGPQAQEVLRPFLDREGYLFSPAHAVELINAKKRANRKTKVQPSQANRKKARPKRKAGECYETNQFTQAIRRACQKAGIDVWHANQLRHAFATRVRAALGLEAAQVALGHTRADVTQVYAETSIGTAIKVAGQIG